MVGFINKEKIIEAYTQLMKEDSNKWQLCLIFGYTSGGSPITLNVQRDSEEHCRETAIKLGLIEI